MPESNSTLSNNFSIFVQHLNHLIISLYKNFIKTMAVAWRLDPGGGAGGGGGTRYNDLYGEAPPERGTSFRVWVYETEREGISSVKYMKGKGYLSFRSIKRLKRIIDSFYGCERLQKPFQFCDLLIF